MAKVDIRLDSGDWFYITGRGAVATFQPAVWPFDPSDLLNQQVKIDEKLFLVIGIERYAVQWRPGSTVHIGLLVKPMDDEISQGVFYKSKPRTYESIIAEKGPKHG